MSSWSRGRHRGEGREHGKLFRLSCGLPPPWLLSCRSPPSPSPPLPWRLLHSPSVWSRMLSSSSPGLWDVLLQVLQTRPARLLPLHGELSQVNNVTCALIVVFSLQVHVRSLQEQGGLCEVSLMLVRQTKQRLLALQCFSLVNISRLYLCISTLSACVSINVPAVQNEWQSHVGENDRSRQSLQHFYVSLVVSILNIHFSLHHDFEFIVLGVFK